MSRQSRSFPESFYLKVRMTLDDENVGMGLKLGPGTFGMNVPSTCTIVIIAGTLVP